MQASTSCRESTSPPKTLPSSSTFPNSSKETKKGTSFQEFLRYRTEGASSTSGGERSATQSSTLATYILLTGCRSSSCGRHSLSIVLKKESNLPTTMFQYTQPASVSTKTLRGSCMLCFTGCPSLMNST